MKLETNRYSIHPCFLHQPSPRPSADLKLNFLFTNRYAPRFPLPDSAIAPYLIKPGRITRQVNPSSTPDEDKIPLSKLVRESQTLISSLVARIAKVHDRVSASLGNANKEGLTGPGVTDVFGLVGAACTIFEGRQEEKEARAIHDEQGRALGSIKLVKGICKTASFSFTLPFKGLMLLSAINSSRLFLSLSSGFSQLAAILSVVGSCLSLTSFCLKVHELHLFHKELSQVINSAPGSREEKAQRVFLFLKAKIQLSEEEKEGLRTTVYAANKFSTLSSEQKEEILLEKQEALLKKKAKEYKRLTSTKCFKDLEKAESANAIALFDAVMQEFSHNLITNAIGLALSLLGIACACVLLATASPAALMTAAIGSLVVSVATFALDTYKHIHDYLKENSSSSKKVLLANAIGEALSAIGLLCVNISLIVTSPAALAITVAGALLVSLSSLTIDACSYASEYLKGEPGKYDKSYLLTSSLVCLLTAATVILVAFNWLAILCAGLFAIAWLGINGLSYYKISEWEKKKVLTASSSAQP